MAGKHNGTYSSAINAPLVTNPRPFDGTVMRISIVNEGATKTYEVHKKLLYQKSPYFAALPNFKEGEENLVTLNDINHDAFANIVYWMYKDEFDLVLANRTTLIHTWAVADRLMMVKCKNVAMDDIRRKFSCAFTFPDYLEFFYNLGYLEDSPLARFITDQVAHDCQYIGICNPVWREKPTEVLRQMSEEAKDALLLKIMENYAYCQTTLGADLRNPSGLHGCRYHDHTEGEECYLKVED